MARKKPWKWELLAAAGRVVNQLLAAPFALLGKRRQAIAVSTIIGEISYIHETSFPDGTRLKFFCPAYKPANRALTVLTKQPEVPGWIDGFAPGDVLWDIGANVGAYALYASRHPKVRVLAFEPEASNFFVLTRNVALNNAWDRVRTYCMAISDGTRLDELSLFHLAIGGSKHAFGDVKESWIEDSTPVFKQGMIGVSVDDLVEKFHCDFPNHLKIDVDGIEEKIILGARRTLKDPRLRSILIEFQDHKPEASLQIRSVLSASGFSPDVQVGANVIYRRAS